MRRLPDYGYDLCLFFIQGDISSLQTHIMRINIKNGLLLSLFLAGIFCLPSCVSTRRATYFYRLGDTTLNSKYPVPQLVIQPNDILSISVSSLNPQASSLFNPVSTSGTSSDSDKPSGYLVNREGYIQFPILGNIKVSGLTEEELRQKITNELNERKLLSDPIVSVQQLNFKVTVLGEVNHPGVIPVKNQKISLLEAIGDAGDLTIYAQRNNVLLIRTEPDGDKMIRRINLTSNQLFDSPYYYLKNNDIIYVEPNKTKVASTGRGQIVLPIVFSGISLLIIAFSYLIRK